MTMFYLEKRNTTAILLILKNKVSIFTYAAGFGNSVYHDVIVGADAGTCRVKETGSIIGEFFLNSS